MLDSVKRPEGFRPFFVLMAVCVSDVEELIIRWTVRLSVACYLAFVFVSIGPKKSGPKKSDGQRAKTARLLWTAGLLFFLAHLATSFGFFHDWSHVSAVEHTAEQTEAVVGIHWGGGVYFNYLFALIWTFDVVAWWYVGIGWWNRFPGYQIAMHSFFGFIVFNATVVFGPIFWRYVGGLCLLLFSIPYLLSLDTKRE